MFLWIDFFDTSLDELMFLPSTWCSQKKEGVVQEARKLLIFARDTKRFGYHFTSIQFNVKKSKMYARGVSYYSNKFHKMDHLGNFRWIQYYFSSFILDNLINFYQDNSVNESLTIFYENKEVDPER